MEMGKKAGFYLMLWQIQLLTENIGMTSSIDEQQC